MPVVKNGSNKESSFHTWSGDPYTVEVKNIYD